MPRHPGGGGTPPADSVEEGLRMPVRDPGPDIRKLSRAEAGGLHTIMHLTLVPESWMLTRKAAAVLTLIHECIAELKNPRWKAAAKAAFRIPADQYVGTEFDSLASRFKSVARGEATTEEHIKARSEDYRGYWVTGPNTWPTLWRTGSRTSTVHPSNGTLTGPMSPPLRLDHFQFHLTGRMSSIAFPVDVEVQSIGHPLAHCAWRRRSL